MDEEFSDSFLKVLKLLEVKQKHNLSDRVFNEILSIFTNNEISLYAIKKKLSKLVNIMPKFIEMCINSCIAFTGQFVNDTSCHLCKESRYINNNLQKKKPRKVLSYFSLIDRFKIQYNDPKRSQLLRYRYEYITNENYNNFNIGDIFDGNLYKELVTEGIFTDEHDIALICSTDGYQIFKQKTGDCWVIMFINAISRLSAKKPSDTNSLYRFPSNTSPILKPL